MSSLTYITQAIILNRYVYHENDRVISMYTKDHGKIVAIAVGSSKITSKLAAHLEPMTISDVFIVNGKYSYKIAGAVCQERFSNIYQDLERLRFGCVCLSLVDTQTRECVRDERIFHSLCTVLQYINNSSAKIDEIEKQVFLFMNKLHYFLGFGLDMDHCLGCKKVLQKGEPVIFDLQEYGMVCGKCREKKSTLTVRGCKNIYLCYNKSVTTKF